MGEKGRGNGTRHCEGKRKTAVKGIRRPATRTVKLRSPTLMMDLRKGGLLPGWEDKTQKALLPSKKHGKGIGPRA